MTGLILDIRYVLRGLRRTPGLFGIAVLTIALGVGANTAMFSVIRGVLLRPLPYMEGERLASLWPEKRWSLEMVEDVRDRVRSFDDMAAARTMPLTLLDEGTPPDPVDAAAVTTNYFDVLGVRAQIGRTFTEADARAADGAVVILGYGYWQSRYGGDASVVGRTIPLAGSGAERRTVVGVLPPGFTAPLGKPQVFAPAVTDPEIPGFWGNYGMTVVGRLKPGVAVGQASAELRAQVDEMTPLHPTQFREVRYSPVDVVPLLDTIVQDVRPKLLILMGVVGFILLIASSNVANLLLARSAGRQRDVGLQMALGASRQRVARQVLTEGTMLALVGGTVGVLTGVAVLPLIRSWVAEQVPRVEAIAIDPAVLLFSLLVSICAGLGFGAIPAWRAVRQQPAGLLRESARGASQGPRSGRANDALVAAEVALSLVLLAGAGLMLKSLWQLTSVDVGFEVDEVTTLQLALPPGRYPEVEAREAAFRAMLARVESLAGVQAAGLISHIPLGTTTSGIPYSIEGEAPPAGAGYQVVNLRAVTPGYFQALRIPVLQGRALDEREPVEGEAALLVNETFAEQHWPDADPLGRRVLLVSGDPLGAVVGVVRDIRQMEVGEPPAAEVYVHAAVTGWDNGYLAVRGAAVTSPAIVSALREVEPNLSIQKVRAMRDVVRENLGDSHFFARLFTSFAALALVLSTIGVYGVMSYGISRRVREIGIRMALGATGASVLRTILGSALAPIGFGIVLGTAGALAVTRVMTSLLYEVSAADPSVLAAVALLMGVVGFAGAVIPMARAVRVEPVTALRSD